MVSGADILRVIETMRTAPIRVEPRYVHPDTYAHRKTCPLWSPNGTADHVHDARCGDSA